jgi:tetratricopeptide (TPR) repeat protein
MDHSEANLQLIRKMLTLVQAGEVSSNTSDFMRGFPIEMASNIQSLQGDFAGARATCKSLPVRPLSSCTALSLSGVAGLAYEIDQANTLLTDTPTVRANGKPNPDRLFTSVQVATLSGDYAGGLAAAKEGEAIVGNDRTQALDRDVFLRPYEAELLARTGKIAEAKALIATTPLECDTCVRLRGRIAMLAHDWKDAAHWFALVSARSPSIPFPDADWGKMLLAKGDFSGAIAKFASAHQKGPKFADPLEGWGEALMLQNRSDLALLKFEEANKYTPHWARLHLKWAEALHYLHRDAEAQKQYEVARALWLTPLEKAELVKMTSHV